MLDGLYEQLSLSMVATHYWIGLDSRAHVYLARRAAEHHLALSQARQTLGQDIFLGSLPGAEGDHLQVANVKASHARKAILRYIFPICGCALVHKMAFRNECM